MTRPIRIPDSVDELYRTLSSTLLSTRSGDSALSSIFDLSALPEITIEVEEKEWNSLLLAHDNHPTRNFYIPATFNFKRGNENFRLKEVAIRLKGNTSRRRPEGFPGELHHPQARKGRSSYMVNFGKYHAGQTFYSLNKLGLKFVREDPVYSRELYCHDLYHRYGINLVQYCSFCKFFIRIKSSISPVYYGIYKLMETIDKLFLTHRIETFGDAEGFLWKARYGADLLDNNPDLIGIKKKTPGVLYDLKTNKKEIEEAKKELSGFIRNLNQLKGKAFAEWIKSRMDVELFLKSYAVSVMCGNWDDYWENSNNYYLYCNRSKRRFFMIPYDLENVLGTVAYGRKDAGTRNPLRWSDNKNPLVRKLLLIPEFRNIYMTALYELADPEKDLFHPDHSIPRLLRWRELIKDHINNDTVEDREFFDHPPFWGSEPRYRLLSRPNNYFDARIKSLPRFLPVKIAK